MDPEDNYAEIANRFSSVAQRYCALVDAAGDLDKTGFLLSIYRILPELIDQAIRLPDTDPFESDVEDDPNEDLSVARPDARMSQRESGRLYELLKEKLADANLYWTIFDPTETSEAIQGSLADDIRDVYVDLKKVLILIEKGATTSELAIWDWRFGFYSHWGDHASSALRVIHNLLDDKLTGME
jgi:uncharacterized protein DUF5063